MSALPTNPFRYEMIDACPEVINRLAAVHAASAEYSASDGRGGDEAGE